MTTLITNINQLVNVREETRLLRGKELGELPMLEDAWLLIEDELVAGFGSMKDLTYRKGDFTNSFDAAGSFVLPSWCDSHTHLVFAASRENEFIDKLKGMSYLEIAAKGGGILSSARRIREITEDELYRLSMDRLSDISKLGTGAVEIKSGYGLAVEEELKILRVIRRLKKNSRIPIKASFLGAHTYPPEYKDDHKAYIDLIINEMLPKIAGENLADYLDVFCEKGFFSPEETETICRAGLNYGLKPRIHANQLTLSGGVQAGVKLNAVSVDHLETMDEDAIKTLAGSGTIGTLLPTAAFFLRMGYPPARQMIDAGAAIALASDYNPGSSPSGNMNVVISMACIQMRMLPEEAINAATVNGAYAMELQENVGSITVGKLANLIFTKPIPSIAYLPYAFGTNNISKMMLRGEWVD